MSVLKVFQTERERELTGHSQCWWPIEKEDLVTFKGFMFHMLTNCGHHIKIDFASAYNTLNDSLFLFFCHNTSRLIQSFWK